MRISDWSSDVCSSDLACCTPWAGRRRSAPARPPTRKTPTYAGSSPRHPPCVIGDRARHPSTSPPPTRCGYFNHHGDCNMSTHFSGEGNIGSPPEYREFPNGNDEPSRLDRTTVVEGKRVAVRVNIGG